MATQKHLFTDSGKKQAKKKAHELLRMPPQLAERFNGVVIGLDLGTSMGYSVWRTGRDQESELCAHKQVCLYKSTARSDPKERWCNYQETLDKLSCLGQSYAERTGGQPLYCFEQWVMPIKASGMQAITIFGGLKALTEMHADMYVGISVGQWKKIACGAGNATKTDYVATANKLSNSHFTLDDEDVAAAICIGKAACSLVRAELQLYE